MGLHPDGKSDEDMATGGGAAAIADFSNSFTRQQALRTRVLYLLILAFGLASLSMITMIVLTIPYLTDSGFSRGTAALMVSVLAIPAAISKPVWGFMGDRWSDRLSTSLSFAMNAGGLLLIVAATIAHAVPPLAIGYFIVGWGIGGQIPLQETIWGSYFGRRYIGAVRSAAMPFTMLFSAAGPILVASYYDHVGDYNGAMYGVAAAWAAAAIVILFARRPTHPTSQVATTSRDTLIAPTSTR
jgi:MFS family permease